jgi:hypothetical protein
VVAAAGEGEALVAAPNFGGVVNEPLRRLIEEGIEFYMRIFNRNSGRKPWRRLPHAAARSFTENL